MQDTETSLAAIREFLATTFPQSKTIVEIVGEGSAVVRQSVGFNELRPGGTVSGPVLMATADLALYAAILGTIGIVPLAVTTSLNINFLRRPAADRDIIAVCKLLKLGKTLAVGEVTLFSDGDPEAVAHAVGTYSIPKPGTTAGDTRAR
ncbi:MAG: PaaI family thioesterase [Proteobacteria bacterium]|nr:PaaI family thioesterase [Pseudomonadota bacterium]